MCWKRWRRSVSNCSTRLRGQADALEQLANEDPLTGVANRRRFNDMLSHVATVSAQDGRHWSLAIVDIDHFKQVNDRHSHVVGDLALCAVAEVLRHAAPADHPGRATGRRGIRAANARHRCRAGGAHRGADPDGGAAARLPGHRAGSCDHDQHRRGDLAQCAAWTPRPSSRRRMPRCIAPKHGGGTAWWRTKDAVAHDKRGGRDRLARVERCLTGSAERPLRRRPRRSGRRRGG